MTGHASLRAAVRCNESSSCWHGSRCKTSLVVMNFRNEAKLTEVLGLASTLSLRSFLTLPLSLGCRALAAAS